jgi:hypothetical protein
MSTSSKRVRSVSFRVSDEEYEALKDLHVAAGASSISDFTRSAVNKLLSDVLHGKGCDVSLKAITSPSDGNGDSVAPSVDTPISSKG